MRQRTRLWCPLACVLSLASAWADDEVIRKPCLDKTDCDVLVVGAGAAGVPAAIQAARAGAKTILMEAGPFLGGNTTLGGVNSPESYFKWGEQRIKGIGWEWCVKTADLDNREYPDSKPHFRINPGLLVCVGEQLLKEAGVEIRYYEAPATVGKIAENGCRWKVVSVGMGELRVIRCKQLVDCTGNGTLAALAGAQRMREAEIMAGSINYTIKHNINVARIGRAELERRYEEALQKGTLKVGDCRHGIAAALSYQAGNYVYDADNSTAPARTDTNLRGRESVMRMLRFIRSLPGGQDASLTQIFPEVGVRETWRVKGELVMKVDDYLSGKKWDDSVCFACYQVDLHKPLWKDFVRRGVPQGVLPTVPLRAMIPTGIDHLTVAGRCISADRETLSAVRIQATCMATGQAAGAVAALAAKHGTTPLKVDIAEVKTLLKQYDALVP